MGVCPSPPRGLHCQMQNSSNLVLLGTPVASNNLTTWDVRYFCGYLIFAPQEKSSCLRQGPAIYSPSFSGHRSVPSSPPASGGTSHFQS